MIFLLINKKTIFTERNIKKANNLNSHSNILSKPPLNKR